MTEVMLSRTLQWRAGQLPGQTSDYELGFGGVMLLQWRAGQLPGQTARSIWGA